MNKLLSNSGYLDKKENYSSSYTGSNKINNDLLTKSVLKTIGKYDSFEIENLKIRCKDFWMNLTSSPSKNLQEEFQNEILMRDILARIESIKQMTAFTSSRRSLNPPLVNEIIDTIDQLSFFPIALRLSSQTDEIPNSYIQKIVTHLIPPSINSYFRSWSIPSSYSWIEEDNSPSPLSSTKAEDVVRTLIPNSSPPYNIVINDNVLYEANDSVSSYELINNVLTTIYQAGFAQNWFQNYGSWIKKENIIISDQTHILLKMGGTRSSDVDFQAKVKGLLSAEKIDWHKLKNLFDELAIMTLPWKAIREKFESGKILKTNILNEFLFCIIPAFKILQFCSISNFSPASDLTDKIFPKFGRDEQLFSICDVNVFSPEYQYPTLRLNINKNQYNVQLHKVRGIFPKIEYDSKRNYDPNNIFATMDVIWTLNSPKRTLNSKGILQFDNLKLTAIALKPENALYRWKMIKGLRKHTIPFLNRIQDNEKLSIEC